MAAPKDAQKSKKPSSGRPKESKEPKESKKRVSRLEKRAKGVADLEQLEKAVADLDLSAAPLTKFSDIPLSEPTASGLHASHFHTLTEIQARATPLALKHLDVLGAAKTGSGKTLAFLVPVLEKLYRARWTEYDGLGALIISPTRELAIQIFEVLKKIGRNHLFSAGLIIGGKSLKEEASRLARMNILVCTPGRLLQHLDQTAGFDPSNLQILVLDEADRIMDMGFQKDVDAVLDHLPRTRQTLMFSATQSKKVSDLARLSLRDPEYVSVHGEAQSATPVALTQHYILTPLPEKLDTLFGFIRSNVKSKMIIFLSSGKQVRFAYEAFKSLRPGIPLLHLHGRQKQGARIEITSRFTTAQYSCLFATDVVARGVDFPAVDWVVQVDCPEDVDTYIHRVGRTARFESKGQAVLFLDPSEEEGMLKRLEHRKVPLKRVNVKEGKKKSIKSELQQLCFQNPDVKYLAQKAFISYTRSVNYQKDKSVFKLGELDLDGFAGSMGLPGAPQIKFHKGEDVKKVKNASRMMNMSSDDSDSEFDEEGNRKEKTKKRKKGEVRTKYDKMFERTNQDVLSSHYSKLVGDEIAGAADGDEEENFLTVKRVLGDEELDESGQTGAAMPKVIDFGGKEQLIIDSKRREKLLKSKKKLLKYMPAGERLVFDDDGVAHQIYELKNEEDFKQEGPAEEQRRKFLESEAERVREADVEDKMLAKDRMREKKDKRKAREREEREEARAEREGGGGDVAMLAGGEDDGEDPLALLKSLPTQGGGGDSSGEEEDERPRKKARKWFQDEESGDEVAGGKGKKKRKANVIEIHEEPETLEDLEALAAGLLE
ncbi:probable ATP-dependent RNA helicase [Cephalotrichum gorgonifer]|uniref:ATP-dependent RNA helicase n=1 Tax=Cephalotrichum gorgonifer TaxID=2041049 RepID=A0AAE8MT53_9PEZI|nr:probable ATP-dependent RNA helicase [Cephalotrichum gorgonifer]